MKTIKCSLLLFLATASLIFTSCSSDDDKNGGPETADTYIRFTAGGQDYDFENIITAEAGNITFNGNNGPSLTDPGDMQISIWVPKTFAEGTHAITAEFSADYTVAFSADAMGFDFDFASGGTIVITKKTADYVEGTFTATIVSSEDDTNSIVISNGSFRAMNMD